MTSASATFARTTRATQRTGAARRVLAGLTSQSMPMAIFVVVAPPPRSPGPGPR